MNLKIIITRKINAMIYLKNYTKYNHIYILLTLVISSINCQNLRDLKLERDNEKYKILAEVANNTVYQLYNKTVLWCLYRTNRCNDNKSSDRWILRFPTT